MFLVYFQGYFRKGCILEAMERYDDVNSQLPLPNFDKEMMLFVYDADIPNIKSLQALAAFQIALQYNPQSAEVSRKIKRLSQLAKDKKRAQEVQNLRSNIDMAKSLGTLKSEMVSSLNKSVMISTQYIYIYN